MLVLTSRVQWRLLGWRYGFISCAIQITLAMAYMIRPTMSYRPTRPLPRSASPILISDIDILCKDLLDSPSYFERVLMDRGSLRLCGSLDKSRRMYLAQVVTVPA